MIVSHLALTRLPNCRIVRMVAKTLEVSFIMLDHLTEMSEVDGRFDALEENDTTTVS